MATNISDSFANMTTATSFTNISESLVNMTTATSDSFTNIIDNVTTATSFNNISESLVNMATTTLDSFMNINDTFDNVTTAATFTNITTTTAASLSLNDFLEYRLSLKINLYYLPFIVSVGIPGNIISFVVLVFSSFRKSTTARYLAVISLLDTVVLCCSMVWLINREFPELRVFREGSCKVFQFLFYFTIHLDVMLLLAMTVERFIVVTFPLRAHALVSMKKTSVIIACAGLLSCAINMHHFFTSMTRTSRSTGVTYCGSSGGTTTRFFKYRIYPWIDSFIYCILPLTSIFILNIAMMFKMKKATEKRLSLQSSRSSDSPNNQTQITVMLLLVSFFFLILTGPIGVILILERFSWLPVTVKDKAVNRLVHSFADNMMFTNHAINFLFYCFSGTRFRIEVKQMICCLRCRRIDNVDSQS